MKGRPYTEYRKEFMHDITDINPQLQAALTKQVEESIQHMEKTNTEKMVEKLEIITWQLALTNILLALLTITVLRVGS